MNPDDAEKTNEEDEAVSLFCVIYTITYLTYLKQNLESLRKEWYLQVLLILISFSCLLKISKIDEFFFEVGRGLKLNILSPKNIIYVREPFFNSSEKPEKLLSIKMVRGGLSLYSTTYQNLVNNG